MSTILIADLIARGVHIEPYEAVAIAQLLIESGAVAPSPENVELTSAGGATCAGCDATPAVFEIAVLLHSLIPAGTPRVPGGLRYAIARALLDVDAPPFDSLGEFSRSLERFERGDRDTVVRALVRRGMAPVALHVVPRPSAPAAAAATAPRATPPVRRLGAAAAAVLVGAIGVAGVAHLTRSGQVQPRTVAGAGRTIAPAPASVVDTPRVPIPAPRAAARKAHAPATAVRAPAQDEGRVVAAVDRQRRPVFSPAFASNGSALFFHTGGTRAAQSAIAVASSDVAGGDLGVMTIVDDGARNYHVQPSPDGTRIAFDSDRDGERGVYLARRDGVNVRRISGPGYAAVPTWAPDGRRIAYIRAEPDNPKVWNLWVQSLDEERATRLTSYRYGQTWSASWFPDNRRICYSHEDTLVVLDLDTGATRSFAAPVKGRLVRTPAVSPDGTLVIFQVFREGGWMLDLRDGTMRSVLADPTAEEFAWSPDGRRVAFHSRRDGQWGIFVISPGA
jgi:Tol biopolymer transport system component